MRDQSHKDEMASALHADFARLRARGIETTLAPHQPPPSVSEPLVSAEPPVAAAVPIGPAVTPEVASSRFGWLARLRGR